MKIGHPNDVGHQALAEVVLTLLPSLTTNNSTVDTAEGGGLGEPGTEAGGGEEAGGGGAEQP